MLGTGLWLGPLKKNITQIFDDALLSSYQYYHFKIVIFKM